MDTLKIYLGGVYLFVSVSQGEHTPDGGRARMLSVLHPHRLEGEVGRGRR